MRNIVLYRDHLLPPSETFILRQGEMLKRFRAYYTGSRRVKGLKLPADRTIALTEAGWGGRFQEILFKLFDSPGSLVKLIQPLEPLLIHAHFGPDGVRALPLAEKLGIPLIVTFHGFDATTRDEYARRSFSGHRKYIRKREHLIERTTFFIAVSDFIKDKMVAQGYPSNKIRVHYIGVDTEYFQPQTQVQRVPLVLFVGRLVRKKGCEYLLRAMAEVLQEKADAQLVIIGDGPERKRLMDLARISLTGNYRFLGFRPQSEVRRWLNRATVLVTPSVTDVSGDSEGLPITTIEALAMGTPVVGFRHAGIPEAVEHGQVGLLSEEKDWPMLGKHILKILRDPELWRRLNENARPIAVSRFSLRRQTEKLEDIYDSLLEW